VASTKKIIPMKKIFSLLFGKSSKKNNTGDATSANNVDRKQAKTHTLPYRYYQERIVNCTSEATFEFAKTHRVVWNRGNIRAYLIQEIEKLDQSIVLDFFGNPGTNKSLRIKSSLSLQRKGTNFLLKEFVLEARDQNPFEKPCTVCITSEANNNKEEFKFTAN
jgi:hypothetical protein